MLCVTHENPDTLSPGPSYFRLRTSYFVLRTSYFPPRHITLTQCPTGIDPVRNLQQRRPDPFELARLQHRGELALNLLHQFKHRRQQPAAARRELHDRRARVVRRRRELGVAAAL